MTDTHCHILYGLDDGARDFEESKQMLHAAVEAGIDEIVATPHVRRLPFDRALAVERLHELRPFADALGIFITLGFEVHWNVLLALDEASFSEYCFLDRDVMLLEFSLSAEDAPQGHEQMIYRLQRSGLSVMIAHPERYPFVQRDLQQAERWHDMGCELQLDAICLKQDYEAGSKRAARALFSSGQADYFASDAHCAADYKRFSKALKWIEKRQ